MEGAWNMTIEYKDSKRIVKLSTDTVTEATRSDFTGTWTSAGTANKISASNGTITSTFNTDNSVDARLTYDLGAGNVSDTIWILRAKVDVTNTISAPAQAVYLAFGISDTTTITGENGSGGNDFIGGTLQLQDNTQNSIMCIDGSFTGGTNRASRMTSGNTYYVEIQRVSETSVTMKVFSDASYSTQVGTTSSNTPSSSLTGGRYLFFQHFTQTVSSGAASLVFSDMKFYNSISEIIFKPTNVQDNSILVEKDTAKRYWFSAGGTTGSDINLQTNTAIGTGGGSNPDTIMACKSLTALTAGDQISKIGFDAQATSNQPYGGTRLVLYTDNSGTPATLIGYTANLNPSGTGWFEGTLVGGDHTITESEAGYIWIGIWGNASVAYFKETLSSGIKQMTQTFASSGAPNTTFSVDTTHNSEFKARLTYKDGTLDTWTMEPTFEDDFSSDNYTHLNSNTSVSGGKLLYAQSSADNRAYRSITEVQSTFVIEWETVLGTASSGHRYYSLVLSEESTNVKTTSSNDGYAIVIDGKSGSVSSVYIQEIYSGTVNQSSASNGSIIEGLSQSAIHYFTFSRSGNVLTVESFSDSARTVSEGSGSLTLASTSSGFVFLQHGTENPSTTVSGVTIDNLKFYNGVSDLT